MEETKEKILTDKMSGLTDEDCDVINEGLETVADSDIDEAIQIFENDSDVQRLKAQQAELMSMMSMISDPKIMKAYRSIRKDVYGYGANERRQVSQKEKKKKKAKRRMAKKSKR
jgi:hypothetical protein